MSLTKVSYSMIEGAPVCVFDFMTPAQIAAVKAGTANAATGLSTVISTAIASVISNSQGTLFFPTGTYFFGTPVTVDMSSNKGIRLTGTSLAGFTANGVTQPGGTTFTGTAAMESLFIFTSPTPTVSTGYSLEVDHITFKSGVEGTTGPISAFVNKLWSPNWITVFRNNQFTGFYTCILSDLTGSGGDTGFGQLVIRENNFITNKYAVYGKGALGAIVDLVFCDNSSQQGGRIKTESQCLSGTYNISDNLMQGQSDTIELGIGLGTGEISRNYFESNTGILINATSTNSSSSLTIKNNRIYSATNTTVSISGMQLNCEQNFNEDSVLFSPFTVVGKSKINNASTLNPIFLPYGSMTLDYNCVSRFSSLPPATLTGGAYQTVGGSVEVTPIGSVNVEAFTTNSGFYNSGLTIVTGTWVVFQCLVRKRTSANIYIDMWNNAISVQAGSSDNSFTLGAGTAVGDWQYLMIYIKATVDTGASMKWRFGSNGQIDVTNTYVYQVAAPVAGTPIYYCLPNL